MISRSHHAFKLLAAALWCMHSAWIAAASDVHYAAEIWTGTGSVIPNGVIVIADGKITAIGPRDTVSIPDDAQIHDHGNGILIPGLVIAESSIAENGRDEEESLTPAIQAIDGFDFFGRYETLLAAGVTTVQLSPGNQRLMPGQGSVVKLHGDDPLAQTLRESESIRVLLTEAAFNPPRLYTPPVGAVSVDRPLEPTRPQLAGNLTDAVTGLRALMLASQAEQAERDAILSVLKDARESQLPFRLTVRSAAEISAAWRLVDEFQIPAILVGIDQLGDAEDALPWNHELIRGIVLEGESGFASLKDLPTTEDSHAMETWQRIEKLKSAGALSKTALTVTSRNFDDLWFVATRCLASGIEPSELLSLMTANPAKMMAIDNRVGTLAEGKDADFVVLTGKPFTPQGKVIATYIDGRSVFERESRDEAIVIRAATIETPAGTIQQGEIVISNGRIRGVGTSVSSPRNATFVDFPDGVVVPGFIDSDLRVGVGSGLSDRLPLNQKIGTWLATDDPALAIVRQGGITTGLLASTNRPSPVVAFKLTDTPRVLADPVAIRYAINGNLTSEENNLRGQLNAAKAYADSWRKYEAAYAEYTKQLAEYEQAKAKYDAAIAAEAKKKEEAAQQAAEAKKDGAADSSKTEGDKPATGENPEATKPSQNPPAEPAKDETAKEGTPATGDSKEEPKLEEPKKPQEPPKPQKNDGLEATRPLIEGKLPAIVDVDNTLAVQLALKLFVDEFKLKLILSVSGNSYLEADSIAEKSVPVVVSPPLETRVDGQWIDLVEVYRRAGAKVVVASGAGTGAKNLPLAIAYSSFNGLGIEDALHAVTDVPASLLGIPSVGAIASGNDADFVVFSGPAFEPSSRIIAVMIDGRWVYRADEKETEHK